jgi:hypothetical protein
MPYLSNIKNKQQVTTSNSQNLCYFGVRGGFLRGRVSIISTPTMVSRSSGIIINNINNTLITFIVFLYCLDGDFIRCLSRLIH